jgi:polysaccharide export outer membrane protein
MKRVKTLLLFAVLLAANSSFLLAADGDAKKSIDMYTINAGDKLNIQVYREPDLTGVFAVSSAGKINYPLLGEIQAEGLTPEGLRVSLEKGLAKDYLVKPQVEVTFQESLSNSVTVVGEIEKPGNYILTPKTTLLKMIFQVGGAKIDPSRLHVKLIRTAGEEKKEFVKLNLEDIINGEQQDIALEPGDMIFVHSLEVKEEKDFKDIISILGQVRNSGNYQPAPDMTLIKLIAEAGGFTPVALTSHVKIVRFSKKGEETVFYVNAGKIMEGRAPDVPLEPGDLVVVSETFF